VSIPNALGIMKSKHTLMYTKVCFCIASLVSLAAMIDANATAIETTNHSTFRLRRHNATMSEVDEQLSGKRMLGVDNASLLLDVAIFVQASGSMRLRSSAVNDINEVVLQWHMYCETYMQDAWRRFGYNKSLLIHSFDWVLIDNSRLGVLFVSIYPNTLGEPPRCLSSEETMQNTSSTGDVCSSLTLGGFGANILSADTGKLVVKTNQHIETLHTHRTHTHVINSVHINRLAIAAALDNFPHLISLQNGNSRASIFDDSVVPQILPRLSCDAEYLYNIDAGWCGLNTYSPNAEGSACHEPGRFDPGYYDLKSRYNKFYFSIGMWGKNLKRSDAVAYCNRFGSRLVAASTYEEVVWLKCSITRGDNIWMRNERTGQPCVKPFNGIANLGAFYPPIPDVRLWASGEPNCQNEIFLQLRENGDLNDEDGDNVKQSRMRV